MTVPVDSGLVKRAKITYYMYTGTHLMNTPEKRSSTILQTLCSVPNAFTLCLWTIKTHDNPVKWRGSPVPTVHELHKIHLIIWTLVYVSCKIVRHIWWIQRRAFYHAQPHMATERSKIVSSLCSTARVHITTPQKYTESP